MSFCKNFLKQTKNNTKMKQTLNTILFFILLFQSLNAQTGWVIQPSFTSQNLYDCKASAYGILYTGSDNGKVFRSTNNGANWVAYNFNDNTLSTCSFKYVMGGSNDNWSAVGTTAGYGFSAGSIDSVYHITGGQQPSLEAFSYLSGYFFYSANIAAGTGGKFYVQDNSNNYIWRTETNATNLANGRNINYSWGNLFVGDNGLIMLADSIGLPNGNYAMRWHIIPSGTNKNLNCIVGDGTTYIIGGDDGTILKSTNYGNNWTAVQSPTTEDIYGGWLNYGYMLCGANGTILRSYSQNYNTWYLQESNTTEDLYYINTLSYSEFIAGGRNGIFLRTTDGGGSLKRIIPQLLIEGFYDAATNLMIPDTVTATIRASSSPYNILSVAKGLLNNGGYGVIDVAPIVLNSVPYWIQINHRNSIETWSKTTALFTNNDCYYYFTPSANMAYGDNQKQVNNSPVRYAFYGGDCNQDGTVDVGDLINVYNDINNSGYINTDVTGDNYVDVSDLLLTYNNANNVISIARP